ncbi:MAG: raiA [Alphaproteobacteria bacterium]|nr:raiA [Alphaproteobacteria bacterium]
MQVIIQGQQVDVGDALRNYVQEKITDTCQRYFTHTIQSNVHFAPEANGFRTDITLSVGNGIMLKASGSNHDPYPAFDQASSRLVKQLKRYKDRLRDHHQSLVGKGDLGLGAPANEYTLPGGHEDEVEHGEGGDAPLILAEMPTRVESLSVSDAVMRMDLADLPAMLFKNAKHGRLNLVYRRSDGQIGWVDPAEEA